MSLAFSTVASAVTATEITQEETHNLRSQYIRSTPTSFEVVAPRSEPDSGELLSPSETAVDDKVTGRAAPEVTLLRKQLESERTRSASLLAELEKYREFHEGLIVSAVGDATAMLILRKIGEDEGLDLGVLECNRAVPTASLAFGLLWRANLVACYGNSVVPTDLGAEVADWYASANIVS